MGAGTPRFCQPSLPTLLSHSGSSVTSGAFGTGPKLKRNQAEWLPPPLSLPAHTKGTLFMAQQGWEQVFAKRKVIKTQNILLPLVYMFLP